MEYQNCETCAHSAYDETQGYVCTNPESEYISDFVESDHYCGEYEPKEE